MKWKTHMARNGSGVYSLPPGSAVINGDTSDGTDLNTPLSDIEADLNVVRPIVAGGTGANSAAGTLTNLGIGEAQTVVGLSNVYALTTGTPTAYTMTTGLSLSELPLGYPFLVIFDQQCGDNPTLDVDGLGPKNLHSRRRLNGGLGAIKAGQIRSGASVMVRYNGTEFACWGAIDQLEDIEYAYKTADETRTSTASNAVDDTLNINLGEIGKYKVDVGIMHTAGAGAFKYRINKPTNSVMFLQEATSGTIMTGDSNIVDPDTSTTLQMTTLTGSVEITESAAIQLAWSQSSSDAADTTVKVGSYMHCTYIGQ